MRKVLFGVFSAVLLYYSAPVQGSGDAVSKYQMLEEGSSSGHSKVVPWSGDWWNQDAGELFKTGRNGKKSYKWNKSKKTYEIVPNVKFDDQSPFRKYDTWQNQTDDGASVWEYEEGHHVDPEEAKTTYKDVDHSWWGHCNGWAAAACLEREPFHSVQKGGTTWFVRDLKGLLTESYYSQKSDFYGSRFYEPNKDHKAAYEKAKVLLKNIKKADADPKEYKTWYEELFDKKLSKEYPPTAYKGVLEYVIEWYDNKYTKAYEDINPSDFHQILTNIIGADKGIVVFDITAGAAVWNYPAYAYTTDVQYEGKKNIKYPNGKTYKRRVYQVTTTVTYADDGVSQQILGTRNFKKTYTCELYTTIYWKWMRGGKWTGESVDDHPDFAWFPKYNPTGVDYGENPKLIYSEILKLLPKHNLLSDASGIVLSANGVASTSLRTEEQQVTYFQATTTGKEVTFSISSDLTNIATVKYYEQEVQKKGKWNEPAYVIAKNKAMKEIGEGTTATLTMKGGTRMIVAFALDSYGNILATDEITVKVQ